MKCDRCKKDFSVEDKPGALLFSPPTDGMVRKIHLCHDCYDIVMEIIDL